MKSFALVLLAACLVDPVGLRAADPVPPEMAKPTKEHDWLKQFVGEWSGDLEIFMEPGKPPVKAKMTEKIRSLGGFWTVSEGTGEMAGFSYTSVLTIGYDATKKKYVGTWIDSMSDRLWTFEGSVDKDGKTLTLEAEGPCPCLGGKVTKMKEVTEFQDKDTKVYTSLYQGEDGKWAKAMTATSKRKK